MSTLFFLFLLNYLVKNYTSISLHAYLYTVILFSRTVLIIYLYSLPQFLLVYVWFITLSYLHIQLHYYIFSIIIENSLLQLQCYMLNKSLNINYYCNNNHTRCNIFIVVLTLILNFKIIIIITTFHIIDLFNIEFCLWYFSYRNILILEKHKK